MLPQSANARQLLKELVKNPPSDDFPAEAAEELLKLIPCNEEEKGGGVKQYKCKICGQFLRCRKGKNRSARCVRQGAKIWN